MRFYPLFFSRCSRIQAVESLLNSLAFAQSRAVCSSSACFRPGNVAGGRGFFIVALEKVGPFCG
jgi:hypothetical protein